MNEKFNFAKLRLPYAYENDNGIFNYIMTGNRIKVQYYLLHCAGRSYLMDTFSTPLTVPPPPDWNTNQDCAFTRYLEGLEHQIRRQMARTNEPITERHANIKRLIQNYK